MNGFWILFSTQLGLTEAFARTVTDILWSASPRIRQEDEVRKVYYTVLFIYALFGMWAIRQATPGTLIVISAFIAAFNFVVLGTHVLVVHRTLLPPKLRMPGWRAALIGVLVVMFAVFTFMGIQSKWSDIQSMFG